MSEKDDLIAAIALIAADYRSGEIDVPTSQHVERWVSQFDEAVRLPMLREMAHILRKTYFSRSGTVAFLEGLFGTEKLSGQDPCAFWKNAKFLDIQGGGASQKEMLRLFSKVLEEKCNFKTEDCGEKPEAFIYLDDGIFTGNRARQDLEKWIFRDAPASAQVHIITIAQHSGGQFYSNGKIVEAAKSSNKDIKLKWWRAIELEDTRYRTDTSDVLRPTSIPEDASVKKYVAGMKYPPHLRNAGQVGKNAIFSSDEGRQLIEQEFLKAGVRIREMCPHLGDTQRPLGHATLDILGFGSLIVTFRNCPNNAPLALWAGDPWYPLFPRKTNTDTSLERLKKRFGKLGR